MFLYLKSYNPVKYKVQYIKHIPLFALHKLNLLDAEKVKKSFISAILKGQSQPRIEKKSKLFFEKYYPKLIRENALEFIKTIDHKQTDCYIVSASLDIWVAPFAEKLGMKLIATEAEFVEGVFTGKFKTKNCSGPQKVARLSEAVSGKKYDKIIAFGDTSGDKEMLEWATEAQFKFFH